MPQIKLEYEAIIPDKWEVDPIRLELLNALRSLGREVRRDFWATVATWARKPVFDFHISLRRTDATASVTIGTDNELWGILNFGTPPKLILPHRAKALAIQDRAPKTRPGSFTSSSGGATGPVRFRAWAQTRGIYPRGWIEKARAKYALVIEGVITNAIARGIEKGMK